MQYNRLIIIGDSYTAGDELLEPQILKLLKSTDPDYRTVNEILKLNQAERPIPQPLYKQWIRLGNAVLNENRIDYIAEAQSLTYGSQVANTLGLEYVSLAKGGNHSRNYIDQLAAIDVTPDDFVIIANCYYDRIPPKNLGIDSIRHDILSNDLDVLDLLDCFTSKSVLLLQHYHTLSFVKHWVEQRAGTCLCYDPYQWLDNPMHNALCKEFTDDANASVFDVCDSLHQNLFIDVPGFDLLPGTQGYTRHIGRHPDAACHTQAAEWLSEYIRKTYD